MKKINSMNIKITLLFLSVLILPLIGIMYIRIKTHINYKNYKQECLEIYSNLIAKEDSESYLYDIDLENFKESIDTNKRIKNIIILANTNLKPINNSFFEFIDGAYVYPEIYNRLLTNKEYCKSRYGIFYNLFYNKTYVGYDYYQIYNAFKGEEIYEAQKGHISYKARFNYDYLKVGSKKDATYYIAIPHDDKIILIEKSFNTLIPLELICWFTIIIILILALIILPILFSIVTFPIKKLSKEINNINNSSNYFITPNISYISKHNEIGDISRSYKELSEKSNNKIASIEKYSKEISKQLDNPIQNIKEELNCLTEPINNEAKKEHLKKILLSTNKMDNILSKLRLITKIKNQSDNAQQELIPIDLFVKNIVSTQKAENIQLNLRCKKNKIHIAPEYFECLVTEILSNALEASSLVLINTRITRYHKMKNLSLSFDDNGCGISNDSTDIIFSNFYTNWKNKKSHLGLGLPLVHAITYNQCGTIEVSKSKKLGGTCFKVTIPLSIKS